MSPSTEVVLDDGEPTEAVDLLAVTPEVEAQLSVEEEIERRTAQEHTDTPRTSGRTAE